MAAKAAVAMIRVVVIVLSLGSFFESDVRVTFVCLYFHA